ncbi:hypothetical protein Tco_1085278, partial [Tanacetum coccineum]
MVEHNNSIRYNDNKGKRKHQDTKTDPNKKSKVTCWKCGKPKQLKKDYKGGKVCNKANGSSINGLVNGSSNSLKGHYMMMMLRGGLTQKQQFMCVKIDVGSSRYESLNDGLLLHMRNDVNGPGAWTWIAVALQWILDASGVLAFPEASSLSSAESALVCFLAQFSFFLLHLLGYPPLESFTMSLEDSGDLDIPDAAPVDPALEVGVLPKFDMHLYRSSLNETHVRAAPIAMAWRHHDSSVADPFPGSSEYNVSNVAKLREVVISLRRPPLSILYVAGLSNVWKHAGRAFSIRDSEGKVITMAEFLRLPNFKGCKVTAGVLLPPSAARVTHLATPAARLQDIPPKTGEKMVAELPCRKVMDDKEKKKRKAEEKAATKVPVDDNQEEAANKTHVSPPGSVGRMDTLRDQTDEHALSPRAAHAHQLVGGEGGADPSVFEGHWKRISEKGTKNQVKNDKTEHRMEKRGKAKVKSKPKSTKV